jgi:hypothetical protein
MKAKRAAIYARVSTDENRQDPETQLRELRECVARRVFEVVREMGPAPLNFTEIAGPKGDYKRNYSHMVGFSLNWKTGGSS